MAVESYNLSVKCIVLECQYIILMYKYIYIYEYTKIYFFEADLKKACPPFPGCDHLYLEASYLPH